MPSAWSPTRLGNLTGKRVIVTDATNGVGLGTARVLARAGAHVIMAVRNTELGAQRAAEIGGSTEVLKLDLADLSSVRGFTDLLDGGVDIFVNNAGALTQNRSDTVDGFEMTIGTNHLGPFALTNLLFPRIRSQIVNVGSDAHESAKLRLDDMHLRTNKWTVIGAYDRSKLAVMLWGLELDRRLRAAKSPVVTQLTHPGWVASNLSHVSDKPLMALAHRVVSVAANALANDIEQGAAPTLYCISEPIPPGRASPYSGGGRVRLKSDHREAPCRGGRSRSRSIGPAVHRRPRCSGSKPTARAGRTGQGP